MKTVQNHKFTALGFALLLAGMAHASGGHDHGAEGGHDDHANRVEVTQEQAKQLGIKISRAAKGNVPLEIRTPGEIRLDENRVVHVAPQISGIAKQVNGVPGKTVEKGEVLAVIDSRELATAKSEYLSAIEMTELKQECFKREEKLQEKQISAQHDYFEAETALSAARIHERNCRQNLLTYGLTPEELPRLKKETEAHYASYRVEAPIQGTIIHRELMHGELIEQGDHLFTVADLSKVWVDLAIDQHAIASVKIGHPASIHLPAGGVVFGNIDYLSPIVDPATRTATARLTLENTQGQLRPGTFVEALIQVPSSREAIVIPKDSVQLVFDHPTVFVWNNGAFEPREVATGVSDGKSVEILRGISEGELVASVNAFHLKAEVIRAAKGDITCGHGHAH